MKNPSPEEIDGKAHAVHDAQINALLVQLWQKNLPTIRERLDLLDKFGSAASRAHSKNPLALRPSTSPTS